MKNRIFCFIVIVTIFLSGCEDLNKEELMENQQSSEISNKIASEPQDENKVTQINGKNTCPNPSSGKEITQLKTERVIFRTCTGVSFSLVIPKDYKYRIENNRPKFFTLSIENDNNEHYLGLSIDLEKKESMKEVKNRIIKSYDTWLDITPWKSEGYELNYQRWNKNLDTQNISRKPEGDIWVVREFLYPLKDELKNKFIYFGEGTEYRTDKVSSEIKAIVDSFELIE